MAAVLARIGMTTKQWLGLAVLTVATLVTYSFNLGINGFGNAYYTAAVQAGSRSFANALYGSLDFGLGASIDKSPLSLWPMELSVKLFGLNSFALFMPEVLMGLATMLIIFFSVRSSFGYSAAVFAGVAFVTTPVVSIMYRYNNPDAVTVLLITAAVAATLRLNRTGRARWAVVVGVALGLAFLAKLLLGIILLPVLVALYLCFGTGELRKRVLHLPYSLVAFIVSCGWWFAIILLTPADARPYLAGTNDNSIWSLILGYNGIGRLTGLEYEGKAVTTNSTAFAPSGPLRLFIPHAAAQMSWLLPLALLTGVIALVLFWRQRRDSTRFFEVAVWFVSIIFIGVVLSFMQGIFHVYYTLAMVPGVAVLMGVTLHLLKDGERRLWVRIALALGLAASGIWGGVIMTFTPDFSAIFLAPMIGGVAAGLLVLLGLPQHPRAEYQHLFYITLVLSLLLGPAVFSACTIFTSIGGPDPIAGPTISSPTGPAKIAGMNPQEVNVKPGSQQGTRASGTISRPDPQVAPGNQEPTASLGLDEATQVQMLGKYLGAGKDYRWTAAIYRGDNASEIQLYSGLSTFDLGGYGGRDRYPTLQQFQHYVKTKQVRYYLESVPVATMISGTPTSRWVRSNYYYTVYGHWIVYDFARPISH